MRTTPTAVLIGFVLAIGSGCGGDDANPDAKASGGGSKTQPTGDVSTDKLAQVRARGTLVLFTDPAYPPQSFKVKGARRPADTKCAENQLTAAQMAGYDADTGKLVAKDLGVEPCFV